MKVRYVKGTRVIGGVSIGEGEFFTFSAAHLKDPYINKRIRKALLEGRIEEMTGQAAGGTPQVDEAEQERQRLWARAVELGLNPHPNTGTPKLIKAIAAAEDKLAKKGSETPPADDPEEK